MTNRAALIAKIKALLAKTVAAGCTEGEAMSALAKAREMMAAYAIDHTGIAFGGEECVRESKTVDDRNRIRQWLAVAVGRFCECKTWTGPGFEEINFCGLESDVGFAHWLLDMLADFVARERESYLRATWRRGMPRIRRTESDGFVAGCTGRISERLIALAPKPVRGNGRDLVVAKDALIRRKMDELGIKLSDRSRSRTVDGRSSEAGARAGDHAQFSRPLDSDSFKAIGAGRG